MSSRAGPRAAGTDGSDFTHRERVASHYRESVRHKLKVKVCLWVHLFFVTCVVSWYGLVLLRFVKLVPEPWLLVWCSSALSALVGLAALPKNKRTMMYVFAFGTLFSGIGPLMYGASFILQNVLKSYSQGIIPATEDWRVLPIKMAVVAFVIQLHSISIFYAHKLISAWGAKGEKGS